MSAALLRKGWLDRQFHGVNVDVAIWPESMRREAGFNDRTLTLDERKEAAALLRKRADELDPPNGE